MNLPPRRPLRSSVVESSRSCLFCAFSGLVSLVMFSFEFQTICRSSLASTQLWRPYRAGFILALCTVLFIDQVGYFVNIYSPQTKLREGNVFTPVCQSSCSQWGTGSLYDITFCLTDPRPPGTETHPEQRLPLYGKERAVSILLECILVNECVYRIAGISCKHSSFYPVGKCTW